MKAIERAEAESIADAKARLRRRVTRVIDKAWSTVEDKVNLKRVWLETGLLTGKPGNK